MNLFDYGFRIAVAIAISCIFIQVLSFLIDAVKNRSNRLLNPSEYFPDEEIQTLKQVYYLILILVILLSITNFFFDNDIMLSNSAEFYVFNSILDIIISIYLATMLYRENLKRYSILIIFLMPIASVSYLVFGSSLIEIWDFIRIPALIYLIKHLYDKFKSYTDENNLGLSIILLFSIVFFSIVTTIILENQDPLDAIVMVSNAFTSNGYAILGQSPGGKINSLILVWSGYIISGVATATLTAAILVRYNRNQMEEYYEKIDALQASIDELKEKLNDDE